jgi:hypothetical protein
MVGVWRLWGGSVAMPCAYCARGLGPVLRFMPIAGPSGAEIAPGVYELSGWCMGRAVPAAQAAVTIANLARARVPRARGAEVVPRNASAAGFRVAIVGARVGVISGRCTSRVARGATCEASASKRFGGSPSPYRAPT